VHGYALREEHTSWGVEIPPGFQRDHGMLWEIEDHGRIDLFKQLMIDFRRWMAQNGYRDVPLALTEFGILMPADYGYPAETVVKYMNDSFAWLQNARDPDVGLPSDGNLLVQRWAWFSLADPTYPDPNLADLNQGKLTPFGQAFRDYVIQHRP
jgi:hypothetical protein